MGTLSHEGGVNRIGVRESNDQGLDSPIVTFRKCVSADRGNFFHLF